MRIYSDRMEVWNPGLLSSKLTVEDLYQEHPSHPRNPNLAKALYRARVIEQWGTGTLRIIQACEARNMTQPIFTSEMGMFKVRLEKPPRPFSSPQGIELNGRQRQAVAHVQKNSGQITTIQYQGLFSLSERQARRDLKGLIEAGVFESVGSGYTTFYRLSTELRGQ